MANNKIKSEMLKAKRENNVCQWQIAEELKVSEYTLIRWLRHELPKEKVDAILKAIKKLKNQNK